MTRHVPQGLTITNCDSEPVRTPGCIQAHGALLVLRPVLAVSDLAAVALLQHGLGIAMAIVLYLLLLGPLPPGAANIVALALTAIANTAAMTRALKRMCLRRSNRAATCCR